MNAGDGATIYALSSGSPPAAIALVRISGPQVRNVLTALAGELPEPRRATLAAIHAPGGELLDTALTLFFPGPHSATGEDIAELHLHGGRSVVAATLAALGQFEGLRAAEPGEFTRRAFENGRIDLCEAEGLADLLMAETDSQRRAALALSGGALSRQIDIWQRRLLELSAQVEAALDFADEGDVEEVLGEGWTAGARDLAAELDAMLAAPPAERLRDGLRVVIAGPPNAGKSTLLNSLAGREAAITSAIAGTTRDLVEAPTSIAGVPFLLIDTAGLRLSSDEIEAIGVARAQASLSDADLILWLGAPDDCPDISRSILLQSKADIDPVGDPRVQLHVSPVSGEGMRALIELIVQRSKVLLPREGELALNQRHREALRGCLVALQEAVTGCDPIIIAEHLRQARGALDAVTGRSGVEHMLDSLFGAFCIGK